MRVWRLEGKWVLQSILTVLISIDSWYDIHQLLKTVLDSSEYSLLVFVVEVGFQLALLL